MNRLIFSFIIITVSTLTFLTFYSNYTTAQDDEILMLQKKISELENRIKELEGILMIYKEPERILSETGQGWQNKKNWRSLKTGMTEEQVRSILGEPVKRINGIRTLWYYPNIFSSYLSFDEDGRLSVWNEP
ncbi:MAG TPA: outer membrane protein assembly factor BamE [Desulfatiglandales bacterium]|nr:outer membrane protein assembly factor BamE [Desulfatiglandales bacterium]